jgi:transposase
MGSNSCWPILFLLSSHACTMSGWMPAITGAAQDGEGKDWIEQTLGWSAEIVKHRPRYKKVWVPNDIPPDQIDWSQYLPPPGFRVLPRRWVVERTFAWQAQARRLSKDYELLCSTSEAMIYVCMIRLMLRRLTRR